MADSFELEEEIIPSVEEIPNMKVADLKKKLKAFGLPTAGNKNDLVARLIEFCNSSKDIDSLDSSLSLEASQISELDAVDGSTPIKANSQETLRLTASSLSDETPELSSSESKLNSNSNSTDLMTKPLKKRTVPSTNDEVLPQKKLILNRTTTAHTEVTQNPSVTTKHVIKVPSVKSEENEKKPTSLKSLTVAERMALRAKRFDVGNASVTSASHIKVTNSKNSKSSILTPVSTDVEVLKKRAERFGQNVSTVLKELEQKERLLKRKCKFGASLAAVSSSSADESEKKKLRAARFGLA